MIGGTEDGTAGSVERVRETVRIGRFRVGVETDDPRISRAILSSLDIDAMSACGPCDRAARTVSLRLDRLDDPGTVRLPRSEPAATFENVEIFVDERGSTLSVDRESVVRIDPSGQFARGFVSAAHIEKPWIVAHRIFTLAAIELLRGHGAHYIHAGCVCAGERGLLITGGSGAGKSTLTYALARSGLTFLSDDGVFLDRERSRLYATAFPERIKLDATSLSFFKELSDVECRTGKRELRLAETGVRAATCHGCPEAILFPVRSERAASRLREIPRQDAFAKLLSQSIATLDRGRVEAQMDLIDTLVHSCTCFEIETARDFDAIPGLVGDVTGVRA